MLPSVFHMFGRTCTYYQLMNRSRRMVSDPSIRHSVFSMVRHTISSCVCFFFCTYTHVNFIIFFTQTKKDTNVEQAETYSSSPLFFLFSFFMYMISWMKRTQKRENRQADRNGKRSVRLGKRIVRAAFIWLLKG